MKKIILTLLLLFGIQQINTAQEKFTDILDSLSVSNKLLKTDIRELSTDYFDLMRNKQNFYFLDKVVIYVSSYKEFSAFYMFSNHAVKNSGELPWNGGEIDHNNTPGLIRPVPYGKRILLFDNEKNKCYMIDYSDTGSSLVVYSNMALVCLSDKFSYNISGIDDLNKDLLPESYISVRVIGRFEIQGENDTDTSETGDIIGKSICFRRRNVFISKTFSLRDENLKIKDITYDDVIKLLDISDEDLKRVESEKGRQFTLKNLISPRYY